MAALVTSNSYTICIFFNGSFHNFFYGTVMPKVDNFCPLTLHNTSHNIDSSIVAVEKTGGGYNTNPCLVGCCFHYNYVKSKFSRKKLMGVSSLNTSDWSLFHTFAACNT